MDEYKEPIASCCKQLRLSVNLVENAMIQTGGISTTAQLYIL